jgi:hypothetical protein
MAGGSKVQIKAEATVEITINLTLEQVVALHDLTMVNPEKILEALGRVDESNDSVEADDIALVQSLMDTLRGICHGARRDLRKAQADLSRYLEEVEG